MKIRSVRPSSDTPTETITDLENVERLHKSRQLFLSDPSCGVETIILTIHWWSNSELFFISEPYE